MTDQVKPPEPPIQREDIDLVTSRRSNKDNRPEMPNLTADQRSPAAMMRAMGFDPCSGDLSPLQFLCAVMNDRVDMIYKDQKKKERAEAKGGLGLSYRIECAKTAAKYLHMEMPKVTFQSGEDQTFGAKLSDAITSGNERVRTKRMIIETVERISPDEPLAKASYPPIFDGSEQINKPDPIEGHIVGNADDLGLNPEGDMEYNPDDE